MGTPPNDNHSTKIPKSTSTYSLTQIIENINPEDGEFLKYITDVLLHNVAIEKETPPTTIVI